MPNNLILFLTIFSCSLSWSYGQENIQTVAQHPHWYKLLHYSNPLFSKPKSDINSQDYFLAKDGQTNPKSELKATIDGLSNSEQIYCKFPARRIWLEKMGWKFPLRSCPAYQEWSRSNSVKSISLIFASGFLGNPASYFGHPLLKFNFKDKRSPLDLLDTAINYGAFTPPDVGALPYAIYGIFGGYQAGFTSADFFFHKNNYSELELRDLWEYELDFSDDQVKEIVAHLWEMSNAKINYYFFSDNCAFRMGELLELVLEEELVSKRLPFAIPSGLFHKIHDYNLVKEIKLLGSRQTRLREKFSSLSKQEQYHLGVIASNPNYVESNEFKALNDAGKSKILETALDYFSYRMILDEGTEFKTAKQKILRQRFSLPPGENEWKKIPQKPPHEAQKPILTQLGYFYSEKFKDAGSLRLRPVFYDIVSPDSGRPPLSSLSVFDLELNFNDERLWLKSFNLISVESLNLSPTKLPDDGGLAWRFKFGADQLNLSCNTCTVTRFEGGIGKAWELSRSFVLYAMLDPRLQTQYRNSGYLAVTPNLSALITLSDELRLNTVVGKRFNLDSDHTSENMYLVEARFGQNRNWDVRLGFQEHIDRRYSAALGLYW